MSRVKGSIAEAKAVAFLRDFGYVLIETNFYSRFGEIDIIAMQDEVLCFVEVKSAECYEVAVQNITPSKIAKIIKTANVYMKKNNLDLDYKIDAVIVTSEEIELIENITL